MVLGGPFSTGVDTGGTDTGWVPPGRSVVVMLVKGPGTVLKDWVWGWWC